MSRKLFGPGLGGLASSGEAWLVIHPASWPPLGGQASVWGKAGLWRVVLGQERYTRPHLANGPPGLQAKGGTKGGEAKVCPRPCRHSIPLGLFAQQQLASRNCLAGRCLHLLAPGSQAVEQAGTGVKCVNCASSREKAIRIHGHRASFLGGEKGLELDKVVVAYCGHPYYSRIVHLKLSKAAKRWLHTPLIPLGVGAEAGGFL